MNRTRTVTIVTLSAVLAAMALWASAGLVPDRRPRRDVAPAEWRASLDALERALAARDAAAANRAWHEALGAAVRSRRWDALMDVGDAGLRLGELTLSPAEARRAYLLALFRARADRSIEGALGVADAFAALGDREAADNALTIARQLAASSRSGQARFDVEREAARILASIPAGDAMMPGRGPVITP